jgi:uncharacterized coiled-coil protein SlyX
MGALPIAGGTCSHETCNQRFADFKARLDAQEKRLDDMDDTWEELQRSITELKVGLASLNGRIAGYLVAASLLGTIVAFIAQKVLGS